MRRSQNKHFKQPEKQPKRAKRRIIWIIGTLILCCGIYAIIHAAITPDSDPVSQPQQTVRHQSQSKVEAKLKANYQKFLKEKQIKAKLELLKDLREFDVVTKDEIKLQKSLIKKEVNFFKQFNENNIAAFNENPSDNKLKDLKKFKADLEEEKDLVYTSSADKEDYHRLMKNIKDLIKQVKDEQKAQADQAKAEAEAEAEAQSQQAQAAHQQSKAQSEANHSSSEVAESSHKADEKAKQASEADKAKSEIAQSSSTNANQEHSQNNQASSSHHQQTSTPRQSSAVHSSASSNTQSSTSSDSSVSSASSNQTVSSASDDSASSNKNS